MPNIPNTNQPGMYLRSTGDGQNSSHWEPDDPSAALVPAQPPVLDTATTLNTYAATMNNFNNGGEYALAVTDVTTAYPKFVIGADGALYYGNGTYDPTSYDITLSRTFGGTVSPATQLTSDDNIIISSDNYGRNPASSINLWANTSTLTLDGNGDISVAGTQISIHGSSVGFFSSTPVAAQVSGGTLAGVIAGLVALGLFSS